MANVLCTMDILTDEEVELQYGVHQEEEIFAFSDEEHPKNFPLTYQEIAEGQERDEALQQQYTTSSLFEKKDFQ